MSEASDSPPGPRIGPYRALRELGRGGQGIVWLAEDTRLGRKVALKVLPHLVAVGPEALKRFRREAEVAARLEHPAICAVLEAELEGETPYIAMRYVPGETLARRIGRAREAGAPPPDRDELRRLAALFETLAHALHAAHEAGIVHRDVKPANLMITPEGEPVILDFGLAREDDELSQALSVSGELSGTPAYMSPEQLRGARPDRRTDVWSLGIAMHEALTLEHPFVSVTREGLFQAVLQEEPADPRRANRAIDRDLATLLETATAKERDRRYQSALDLAEDLRRWRSDEPILARPAGALERGLRWARRKPALAATGGLAALLLVAASAALAYGLGASGRAELEAGLRAKAEQERGRADEARALAERERARADEARAALEQLGADRRLSEALDELNMQLGTLWFGLQSQAAVGALEPKYLAALQAYGVDLRGGEPAEQRAAFLGLRERAPDRFATLLEGLDGLRSIVAEREDPESVALRQRLDALRADLPGVVWPELEQAKGRWRSERVDAFDALVEEDALRGRSPEQLVALVDGLMSVPERLPDAERVVARALAREPGSFRLRFLAAALGFLQLSRAPGERSEAALKRAQDLLHQMEVAVALRPRSGFVRGMLASALALNGRFEEALGCMDAATELEPDNAIVWLLRARFYSYSPMPQAGIEACRRALELDPELGGVRELLAELEARLR